MSKSTPSLLALLGLVAVAGYQNRGRISDMLADARQSARTTDTHPDTRPDGAGFLSEIGQTLQAGLAGTGLSAALSDLVARFKAAGQGAAADSWVSTEANRPIDVDDLEAGIGEETLAELSRKTGLSKAELLLRLNVALPEVVDRMTPNGRLPTEDEAQAIA